MTKIFELKKEIIFMHLGQAIIQSRFALIAPDQERQRPTGTWVMALRDTPYTIQGQGDWYGYRLLTDERAIRQTLLCPDEADIIEDERIRHLLSMTCPYTALERLAGWEPKYVVSELLPPTTLSPRQYYMLVSWEDRPYSLKRICPKWAMVEPDMVSTRDDRELITGFHIIKTIENHTEETDD